MNKTPHLDSLDMLRAAAAILVCLHHAFITWGAQDHQTGFKYTLLHQMAWDLDLGKIGVMIFFLISGYLIPFTVSTTGLAAQKVFIKKRFFRIYPMFIVAITFGLLINALTKDYQFDLIELILNIFLVPNLFGQEFISGVFWTLQIEIFFYLIVASAIPWVTLNKKSYLVSCMLIALALGAEAARAMSTELGALRELSRVFGMTSFIFLGSLLRFWRDRALDRVGTVTLVIFLTHEFIYRTLKLYQVDVVSAAPKFSSLAGAIAVITFLWVLLVKKGPHFLVFLGRISYSLYLVHMPVILLTVNALAATQVGFRGIYLDLLFFSLILIFSISISAVTYRYVELRYLRR